MRIQLTDAEQADGRMHEAHLVLAVRLLREVGAVKYPSLKTWAC